MALAFDIYLHDKHNIENLHHIIPNMQTDLIWNWFAGNIYDRIVADVLVMHATREFTLLNPRHTTGLVYISQKFEMVLIKISE